MTKPASGQSGLTVLEVVIALAILVIGVLAVVGLQTSALRATRTAQAMQRLNADARSEIDVWRGSSLNHQAPLTRSCVTTGEGCVVHIQPCVLQTSGGSGNLDCGVANASLPDAHAVTVTVEHDARELVLTTVVYR